MTRLPAAGHPALVAGLVLALWTALPYAIAATAPPPGTRFAGAFHWIDDFYNYVSYVQQAEEGAFVFRNKLLLEPRPAQLVQVEWWAIGSVARLLGSSPFLAYRLFGAALILALILGLDRALRAAGLGSGQRLPALLLVTTGGGLGGWIFELTDRPVSECLDLSMGLFPFVEALANPHFLAGTTLLVWALLAFGSGRPRTGIALGTLLGLTRPYDLVWLGLLGGLDALLTPGNAKQRLRRVLPMLGLLPVLAYLLWVFFASDAFSSFRGQYTTPAALLFLPALAPPTLLAVLGVADPAASPQAARLRRVLWLWAGLAIAIALLRPPSFGQQFLVGAGLPLLALAALALARRGTPWLLAGLLALAPTAIVATRIVLRPEPYWFVPAERLEAAEQLRPHCRAGERAFAPADIGLYVNGRSACHAFASHPAAPGHAQRSAVLRHFYAPGTPAAERQRLLDDLAISYVVLPDIPPDVPVPWLPPDTSFRRLGTPTPSRSLTWFARASVPAPDPGR